MASLKVEPAGGLSWDSYNHSDRQTGKNYGEAGTVSSTSVVDWVHSGKSPGLNPGSESFWG